MRVFKFLLLVMVVGAAAFAWYCLLPYGPSQRVFVEIAPGMSSEEIAAQLERAGIVRSRWALVAMKEVHGGTWKAGEYAFDHAAPVSEVFKRLRKGDVYTIALVVPEGFNIFDIAQAVQAAGLGDAKTFLRAEQTHTELVAQWESSATSVEGFLFPDTYRFSRHATPVQILTAMVRRFQQQATKLGLVRNVARTVTMASLVEKEVHVDAERAHVAGAFENRLAAAMPLQTDPAVIYASELRGTWTGVIHQSELHSESAYNTYAHAGLPPGPICNPGIAALTAAMHPAKTDDLYFVARPDGTTAFSRTLAEHGTQVRQLLGSGR